MTDISLEEEFVQYRALHKYTVLKAMLIKYYQDLDNAQAIKSPVSAEERATEEIRYLVMRDTNLKEFNRLYERAYQIIASNMEF